MTQTDSFKIHDDSAKNIILQVVDTDSSPGSLDSQQPTSLTSPTRPISDLDMVKNGPPSSAAPEAVFSTVDVAPQRQYTSTGSRQLQDTGISSQGYASGRSDHDYSQAGCVHTTICSSPRDRGHTRSKPIPRKNSSKAMMYWVMFAYPLATCFFILFVGVSNDLLSKFRHY